MARHVIVVMTNVWKDRHDEYNEWYDSVHVPDLLRIPAWSPLSGSGPVRHVGAVLPALRRPNVHVITDELLDLGLMLEERPLASADLLEAVAAFKERRPGKYERL